MKDFNLVLYVTLLSLISFSSSAFVNNVVNTPTSPTVCDAFTLTVNGDLPGTNYAIQSVSQNVSGNTITLNVFIVDQGIGIPVLVPYFVNFNYSGLDEGTYNIVARDYLNGNFSSSVSSSITITGFSSAFTSNITNTSATLNWSQIPCACDYLLKGRVAGSSSYIYLVLNGSTTTSFNAANLTPGTTYEWQVLTNCPATGADTNRAKTPIISFTTGNCNDPNPVNTTNVTNSSATLNWTAVPGAIGYEIWGRAVGGPIVVSPVNNGATTSFQVNSLPSGFTFQWAARTRCSSSPDVFSDFSTIETFTTTGNAGKIGNLPGEEEAYVFPNPFNTNAILTIPDSEIPFTLTITDLSGKTVMKMDNIDASEVSLNNREWAEGMYLFQLYNDVQTHSGKFVVR